MKVSELYSIHPITSDRLIFGQMTPVFLSKEHSILQVLEYSGAKTS